MGLWECSLAGPSPSQPSKQLPASDTSAAQGLAAAGLAAAQAHGRRVSQQCTALLHQRSVGPLGQRPLQQRPAGQGLPQPRAAGCQAAGSQEPADGCCWPLRAHQTVPPDRDGALLLLWQPLLLRHQLCGPRWIPSASCVAQMLGWRRPAAAAPHEPQRCAGAAARPAGRATAAATVAASESLDLHIMDSKLQAYLRPVQHAAMSPGMAVRGGSTKCQALTQ